MPDKNDRLTPSAVFMDKDTRPRVTVATAIAIGLSIRPNLDPEKVLDVVEFEMSRAYADGFNTAMKIAFEAIHSFNKQK